MRGYIELSQRNRDILGTINPGRRICLGQSGDDLRNVVTFAFSNPFKSGAHVRLSLQIRSSPKPKYICPFKSMGALSSVTGIGE